MNKFSWYEAKSVEDALEHVNKTVSSEIVNASSKASVIKAGGVDLLDMIKEGLIAPDRIVNVRNVAGLNKIVTTKDAIRIGATVTLAELEESAEIKEKYLALHQAVAHAATPQIRNMATLGGNLAQRTRCWYFRSVEHECFRKGGSTCFARNGQNENHAILENGSCVSVHASSISTALLVFDAKVLVINSKNEAKQIPLEEFFVSPGADPSRENVLKADEMITEIIIPMPSSKSKSYYIKQGARESYDWSMADVAIMVTMKGNKVDDAKIAMGSAAPVPLRSRSAEKEIIGKEISEEMAAKVAIAAIEKARPLSQNGYKVPLFQAIIKKAILELA